MNPAKILIADDNEMNRKYLFNLLSIFGYSAVFAIDGADALLQIKKEQPDLLLLDLSMPVMTGLEVIEELKKEGFILKLPVIVISAVDELEIVAQCIEQGADDYLIKPFNQTLLKARIKNCLEKKNRFDQEKMVYENLRLGHEALIELGEMKNTEPQLIVHDMNNPLSSIKGYLQLFANKLVNSDNDKNIDFLKKIGEAVLEMEMLTRSMLDISKLETKKIKLNFEKTNAFELARDMYQVFLFQKSENKDCEYIFNEDNLFFMCDLNLMRRVLKNLLMNADKHSPQGTKIEFKVIQQKDKIIFVISDNGYGIPEDLKPRIFEKFFRVESKKLGKKYGVGLGLYFCKMAVEAMNGKIWFESVPSLPKT